MSFIKYKKQISFGDRVIIYLRYDELQSFLVCQDAVHQTKYGAIKHNQIVGLPFGSKLEISKGFVHILHPTCELWTLALPHRTQILYRVDISEIIFKLDIHPGSIVVEAGTGSGSLSHSILRSIYPTGHLHTFDFHAGRVNEARAEFLAHGFDSGMVTIIHRDVCSVGFELTEHSVDAVFLDLPSPWLAIPHAAFVLTEGGRICCFSPCIEQVQRTYDTLRECNFSDLITVECLNRELSIRELSLPIPDLGFHNRNKKQPDECHYITKKEAIPSKSDENTITDNCESRTNADNVVEDSIKTTSTINNNEPSTLLDIDDKVDKNLISLDDLKISKNVELIEINRRLYCKECVDNGSVSRKKSGKNHRKKIDNDISCSNVKSDSDSETQFKKIKLNDDIKDNKFDVSFVNKITNKSEYSFTALSPGIKITGHTGYLTFGTLYPN